MAGTVNQELGLLFQGPNYVIVPGQVLEFNGDNYIQATLVEDSEFVVNLIHKPE